MCVEYRSSSINTPHSISARQVVIHELFCIDSDGVENVEPSIPFGAGHSIPSTIRMVPKSSGYDAVRGSTYRVSNIRSHPTAAPISSLMTQPAIGRLNAIRSMPQILQCSNLYFIYL